MEFSSFIFKKSCNTSNESSSYDLSKNTGLLAFKKQFFIILFSFTVGLKPLLLTALHLNYNLHFYPPPQSGSGDIGTESVRQLLKWDKSNTLMKMVMILNEEKKLMY